jgi:hypothetical protein
MTYQFAMLKYVKNDIFGDNMLFVTYYQKITKVPHFRRTFIITKLFGINYSTVRKNFMSK